MVARVMVDMRDGLAILLGLEAQYIVVVMPLPDLMDRRVLDFLHQDANHTAWHERHRRLQLQQEQQ
jgi:hypothetical protein